MFIYWQFLAVSLGETVFNANPEEGGPAWDQAIAWSGLQNAAYNFVTMVSALFLVGFAAADRRQARARDRPRPGRGGADLAGPHPQPVPRAGPDDRPRHLLGQRGRRALPDGRQHGSGQAHRRLHGDPQHDDRGADADRDGHVRLDLQPPARRQGLQRDHARRRPDGHRGRGHAVGQPARRGRRVADRAARHARAASPSTTGSWSVRTARRPACTPWTGPRRWRRPPTPGWSSSPPTARATPARLRARPKGCTATSTASRRPAKALEKSVTGLTKERVRYIDQRLVRGDPAQALLDTVGAQPGEPHRRRQPWAGRERGAAAGIGPARRREERRCDVLIVQTSALDEERLFAEHPAEASAGDGARMSSSGPGT